MKIFSSNTVLHITFIILIICAVQGCKRHSNPIIEESSGTVEYPVSIIPNIIQTNPSDKTTLYPITEEFLSDFLERANQYEGQHLTIKNQLPQQWGVVCIERLPEGREIYMLQSQNREWIYLVITSGFGTQRILDVIPVAVNLAIQNQDILEKEIWSTQRESDGAFVVDKHYEWVRSVAAATRADYEKNPDAFTKEFQYVDTYYINEMSRFEYIVTEAIPEYSAVIFYYQQGNKPEEWDDYIPILESYCEENEIIFDEIYQNFDQIKIRDYHLNDITEVDITPYLSPTGAGMVMFQKGKEPKGEIFGSYERMKIEIKRYYKIINQ